MKYSMKQYEEEMDMPYKEKNKRKSNYSKEYSKNVSKKKNRPKSHFNILESEEY